ncbi:unnamed protein product, partial [Medioppia subpectinata]
NLLAVAAVLGMVTADKICPDATLIKAPCKFVEVANIKCAIECDSGNALDLVVLFKSLQTSLKAEEKTFVRFVLKNWKITELPANVFADIVFDAIIIEDAQSLKKIHPAAFNGGAYRVKRLDIVNTPVNEAVVTGGDLFTAIQSLPNLANLRLIKTNLTMIPASDNAAIEEIQYTAFPISSVASKDPLEIRLIADHLSYNALVATTFSGINRPVSLYVTDNGFQYIKQAIFEGGINRPVSLYVTDNGFQYIKQAIFEGFVKQNPLNVIISDTDCEDTNNDWLRKTYPKQWNDVNCFGLMNAQARLNKLFIAINSPGHDRFPAPNGIISTLEMNPRPRLCKGDGQYRIKRLDIVNTPVGDKSGYDYDLFKAIQSIPNLANLRLTKTNLTTLPENGIKGFYDLQHIYIEQNKALKTIGYDAFKNLPKLKTLQIKGNEALQEIASTAFPISDVAIKDPLEIRLIADHLNYAKLLSTTFDAINRPVSLYVTDNG